MIRRLLLAAFLTSFVAGCGVGGAITSPTGITFAGTVWSGPFADSGLGSGTMTLEFGTTETAVGRWYLTAASFTEAAALRVIPSSQTDPAGTVTLGLATAILNQDCDMLLNARVDGSQMLGTLRSGRCDSQGERVAEVRLTRRRP